MYKEIPIFQYINNLLIVAAFRRLPAAVVLLALLLPPGHGHAVPPVTGAFEQLHFRVYWWVIPGARAVMEASTPVAEEARFHVQACTNRPFDMLHKVRDRIVVEALRDADGYRTRRYRETIHEGRYRSRQEVTLANGGVARIRDFISGEVAGVPVVAGTMDLLSAFYRLRDKPLAPGDRYRMPVIDNGKAYELLVDVLARERRKTLLGPDTQTLIVRPLLLSKGIFKRDGPMRIWLTDDERHLPVQMESRISLGRIHAELESLSVDPADRLADSLFCEM